MDRVSPDGSIIVVDRNHRDLIHGRYYVFSVRGRLHTSNGTPSRFISRHSPPTPCTSRSSSGAERSRVLLGACGGPCLTFEPREGAMTRRKLDSFLPPVALATLIVVAPPRPAAAQGLWDLIGQALQDGEALRALCAKSPGDDRCKEPQASTVLFWCERGPNDPHFLGQCHARLGAYARLGSQSLAEWRCVPPEVINNEEQLRRLFVLEGDRHPEVLHMPAQQLLYYAVAVAFPCPALR